jgi:hypothetical protein
VFKQRVREDRVKGRTRIRQPVGIRVLEAHVCDAARQSRLPGIVQHRLGRVHADHLAGSDRLGQPKRDASRTAANV